MICTSPYIHCITSGLEMWNRGQRRFKLVVVSMNDRWDDCLDLWQRLGAEVTKAGFVNFSVSKQFGLGKIPLRLFESHLYLTSATAAELRRHLQNKKRGIQLPNCVLTMQKISENNGNEVNVLVTPTPVTKYYGKWMMALMIFYTSMVWSVWENASLIEQWSIVHLNHFKVTLHISYEIYVLKWKSWNHSYTFLC